MSSPLVVKINKYNIIEFRPISVFHSKIFSSTSNSPLKLLNSKHLSTKIISIKMIKEFQVLKLSFYELLTLSTTYRTLKLALPILSHSSLTKIPSDKTGNMRNPLNGSNLLTFFSYGFQSRFPTSDITITPRTTQKSVIILVIIFFKNPSHQIFVRSFFLFRLFGRSR